MMNNDIISSINIIINTILMWIALFFSFKRNNGFNIGSLLIAVMYPEIYIIYAIAVDYNNCNDQKN